MERDAVLSHHAAFGYPPGDGAPNNHLPPGVASRLGSSTMWCVPRRGLPIVGEGVRLVVARVTSFAVSHSIAFVENIH